LIINTIVYILYFVALLLSILGYGLFTNHFLNISWKKFSIGLSGLTGLFCVTFISFITHIFLPHNFLHNIIIHVLGISLLIYFLKKNFYFFKISKLVLITVLFISSLFISKNHEDFPYYHLPYMIQIVEHKLQFGIGLINYSFMTLSSLFYLQSTFYLPFINFFLFHSSGLITLIFAGVFFIDYFTNSKKEPFIRILASLIFVFINVAFARIGGFGTDRSGQIISFVIFILLIEYLSNKETSIEKLKILVILIFYIITVKSYFFPYLILLPFLLIFRFETAKNILFDFKIVFVLTIFFLIFLFLNFSNSACLLYPIKYTCFDNFSWSATSKVAEHYSNWYEIWSKAGATPTYRVEDPQKYIKFLNWVPNWFNTYFLGKGLDVTLIIFFISIIYFFALRTKMTCKTNNNLYFTYCFLILLFIIWFNKHPDLRYGGYVIYALLFFLPLSNYLSKFLKNNLSRFLIIIGFISLVIFNSKNLLRIKNEISDQRELYSFKNFPFFNIRKPEYKMILLNDNSRAYLVINDMCWATPSPCLPSEVKKKTINNYSIFYRE
jgi:hypothetical protein